MNRNLSEIAKIQAGVYAKPAIQDATVYYVQSRHFNENREFDFDTKPELEISDTLSKHYLEIGDIIVSSKGNSFFAAVYKGRVSPAVASTSFLVVRIFNKDSYNSEFIAWQINHPLNQQKLKETAKGSSIPSITKKDLEDLELQIPSLDKQNNIVQIDSLLSKRKQLMQQLVTLNESLINKQLLQFIKPNEQ